jgi:hypothetical protein
VPITGSAMNAAMLSAPSSVMVRSSAWAQATSQLGDALPYGQR